MSKGDKPLREDLPFKSSRFGVRRARAPKKIQPATPQPPSSQQSEVDAQLAAYKHTVETLNAQLDSLDRTIERQEQKTSGTRSALGSSSYKGARLLHLRRAMLAFVVELETRRNQQEQ